MKDFHEYHYQTGMLHASNSPNSGRAARPNLINTFSFAFCFAFCFANAHLPVAVEANVRRDADENAADGKAKQKAKQNVVIKLGLAGSLSEFGEFDACSMPV